jgi:uncharacterized protein
VKILISGASGLIGTALVRRLIAVQPGDQVVRLVRSAPAPGSADIRWDPEAEELDPARVEGFDAVVHLAGENLAQGRWTAKKKTRIRDSRENSTWLLARTLAGLERPPKVLLSASAIGYYGDCGEEELDEQSASGAGFLADVCRAWEAATEPAAAAGIRVVRARMGVVLAPHGGILAKTVPVFRLGLGGRLGSGRQYLSWITLDDAVEAIVFLLSAENLDRSFNLVAPQPVTNRRFTEALGLALRRPTPLTLPAFVLKTIFGEMAREMLLSSARVIPRRLLDAGFVFRDPNIEDALKRLLGAKSGVV